MNFFDRIFNYCPGDYGEAVFVDGSKSEVQKAMSEFGFNTFVSDMISMNRSVPDVRMPECRYWNYPTDLPTASVVIAFHNEGRLFVLYGNLT